MSIADTIAEAKAASANLPSAAPAPTSTAVALPSKRTTAASFLENQRVNVDIFLKIGKDGPMRLGKSTALVYEFEAILDCSQLQFPLMCRYGDAPTVYAKSYDGGATVQGSALPWQRHLELAKAWKPGKQTDPFDTVDLILKLTADVKGFDKGTPVEGVAKAGQVVGYTPPYTGVKPVQALLKEIQSHGGNIETSKARVKVTSSSAKNAGGIEYGLLEMTLLGLVD